jgi:hypothetical protein
MSLNVILMLNLAQTSVWTPVVTSNYILINSIINYYLICLNTRWQWNFRSQWTKYSLSHLLLPTASNFKCTVMQQLLNLYFCPVLSSCRVWLYISADLCTHERNWSLQPPRDTFSRGRSVMDSETTSLGYKSSLQCVCYDTFSILCIMYIQQNPFFTLLKGPSKNGENCGKWFPIHY